MRIRIIPIIFIVAAAIGVGANPLRAEVYLTPEAFVAQVFDGAPPAAKAIWIDTDLRQQLAGVLGHPPRGLRVRYWGEGGRTAWVLDEIGKYEPITIGVVVAGGEIEQLKVLAFRESRGWEIRYPFFTEQFQRLRLTPKGDLSGRVDGITGATLSVSATKRTAKAALLLHDHSDEAATTLARAQ
jgi:hypothetical protein